MHWIDPDSLTATKGTVERFIFNPKGVADGLIFADGTEVHFPPHMASQVLASVKLGDKIVVRGVKPRGAAMLAAVALEPANGRRIVDDGPEEHDDHNDSPLKHHKEMTVTGKITQLLHGPKGEVRGVLLDDGSSGRFPPHVAEELRDALRVGRRVVVTGDGYSGALGTVVDAAAIGSSADDMTDIHHGPKHKKKKAPKHRHAHA